jgi:CheY-like chemotaxis protein
MGKKILICDDDSDILELTESVLEAEGFIVNKAQNCDRIVEMILEKKPDIVLMDLKIPSIGGAEATRRIKGNSQTKQIPVLLFTANNIGAQIAEDVGADGIVEKPFDIDGLISLINSML